VAGALVLSGLLGLMALLLLGIAAWAVFRKPSAPAPSPAVVRGPGPSVMPAHPKGPPPAPAFKSLVPIDGSKIGQPSRPSLPPSVNLLDPDTLDTASGQPSAVGYGAFPPTDEDTAEQTEIFHDGKHDFEGFASLEDTGSGSRRPK